MTRSCWIYSLLSQHKSLSSGLDCCLACIADASIDTMSWVNLPWVCFQSCMMLMKLALCILCQPDALSQFVHVCATLRLVSGKADTAEQNLASRLTRLAVLCLFYVAVVSSPDATAKTFASSQCAATACSVLYHSASGTVVKHSLGGPCALVLQNTPAAADRNRHQQLAILAAS